MPSLWNWTGRPRILPGMVNEADQDWAFDIPSIIMHDLGDHHRASYEFFNGDDNRVAYWYNKAFGGALPPGHTNQSANMRFPMS